MGAPYTMPHPWDVYYSLTVVLDGKVVAYGIYRSRRCALTAAALWQELGAQCVIRER